jgi:hypothetical protein
MATVATFVLDAGSNKFLPIDLQDTQDVVGTLLPLLTTDRVAVVINGDSIKLWTIKDMADVRANQALDPIVLHRGEGVYILFPRWKGKIIEFLAANGWDKMVVETRPLKDYAEYRAFRADEAHREVFSPKFPEDVDVHLADGRTVGFDDVFDIVREAPETPASTFLTPELKGAIAEQLVKEMFGVK